MVPSCRWVVCGEYEARPRITGGCCMEGTTTAETCEFHRRCLCSQRKQENKRVLGGQPRVRVPDNSGCFLGIPESAQQAPASGRPAGTGRLRWMWSSCVWLACPNKWHYVIFFSCWGVCSYCKPR